MQLCYLKPPLCGNYSNQENFHIISFYKLLTSKSLRALCSGQSDLLRCRGMLLLLLLDLRVCSPSLGRHATSEANPVHLSDASSATAAPASVRCMQSLPALTAYSAVTVSLSPGACCIFSWHRVICAHATSSLLDFKLLDDKASVWLICKSSTMPSQYTYAL